jgi:hypothetical protein
VKRQRFGIILVWVVLGAIGAAIIALGPDALSCTAEHVGLIPSPR